MSDELFSVTGQIVVVSGGSRGIGRALAEGFAERGSQVIITGRESATIEAAAREMSSGPNSVVPIVCDVAQLDDIARLVETVVGRFGRIDTLLN
ncbi:MAG TPA: SDR family NAD(P)-dependent oxidoreductase, partial [Planctomycetaceae bacterium]